MRHTTIAADCISSARGAGPSKRTSRYSDTTAGYSKGYRKDLSSPGAKMIPNTVHSRLHSVATSTLKLSARTRTAQTWNVHTRGGRLGCATTRKRQRGDRHYSVRTVETLTSEHLRCELDTRALVLKGIKLTYDGQRDEPDVSDCRSRGKSGKVMTRS
jgi:hypothetical protein